MLRRARDVKFYIDGEAWLNAKPSVALNRLATTASRMSAKPNTAPAELADLLGAVAHVVSLHAPDTKGLAFGAHHGLLLQKREAPSDGMPSLKLQTLIRAWLNNTDAWP